MAQRLLYILAKKQSPRLRYVAKWLSEALAITISIVTEAPEAGAKVLAYGTAFPGSILIPDSGLLWEEEIRAFIPGNGKWDDLLTFFPGEGDIPFDLFSAIFYLLTRYEEYLPFTPDKHGRFPATESILFKAGILRKPIIDLWLEKLRQQLGLPVTQFKRQLTYDIDRAWQYKNWPAKRQYGLWLKALLQGDFESSGQIKKVINGAAKDPLDAFEFIHQIHQLLNTKPVYFILTAEKGSEVDVNLSPRHPAMRQLIQQLAEHATIGLHPSYKSSEQTELVKSEKKLLEHISGKPVAYSRQHFMRLKLPRTYSQLIANAVTDDFSMGYGSHSGFRAGTGRSFFWYDLQEESEKPLTIHPFPFMDTTAHFYEKLDAGAAFSILKEMETELRICGSQLITVFHNYSLGTAPAWKGWQEAYKSWLL